MYLEICRKARRALSKQLELCLRTGVGWLEDSKCDPFNRVTLRSPSCSVFLYISPFGVWASRLRQEKEVVNGR